MLRRTLSLLLAVSLGATGCFTGSSGDKPLPPPSPLRMELEDFTIFAATRIEEAADNILERNESPAINRNSLYWRMRVIPMIRRTLIIANDEMQTEGHWAEATSGIRKAGIPSGECGNVIRDDAGICP